MKTFSGIVKIVIFNAKVVGKHSNFGGRLLVTVRIYNHHEIQTRLSQGIEVC